MFRAGALSWSATSYERARLGHELLRSASCVGRPRCTSTQPSWVQPPRAPPGTMSLRRCKLSAERTVLAAAHCAHQLRPERTLPLHTRVRVACLAPRCDPPGSSPPRRPRACRELASLPAPAGRAVCRGVYLLQSRTGEVVVFVTVLRTDRDGASIKRVSPIT